MFAFEHPYYLYLLWAAPLLLVLTLYYWQERQRLLNRLGEPLLLERLLNAVRPARFWLKNALFALGLAGLAIAWANPQRGAKKQSAMGESVDVFIALDISNSMLSEDVRPSRLELAKIFAQKLTRALRGNQIGLIFFAGDAYLQMPISSDYESALMFLREAGPEIISAQGTAIPAAIELAQRSFDPDVKAGRALVVITDGENHDDDAIEQAEKAYDDGVVTFAVGAGTASGGPIPAGEGVKRDQNGDVVISKLNENLIKNLARAGKGAAFNIGQGDAAVAALKKEINNLPKRQTEIRSFSEFESWYQWFLAPALILLMIEFVLSWQRKL